MKGSLFKNLIIFSFILNATLSFAFETLHYSGRLVTPTGSPVAGPRHIEFDLLRGNTAVCTLLQSNTPLSNGVFNVELTFDTVACGGNTLADVVSDAINAGQELYIQVTDASGPVTYPKQLLTTVPVAIYARRVSAQAIFQTNLSGISSNCNSNDVLLSNGAGGFNCGVLSTTATPTGAAGGDLSGTYPNPALAINSVTTAKIMDGQVTTPKIYDGAVTASKLNQMAATLGQVLKWSGTNWIPASDSGLMVEGDPTVKGFAKYDPPICLAHQILKFDFLLNSGAGGLYCIDLVENAIVDGQVELSPSQNVVFDALALKSDRSNDTQTILAKTTEVENIIFNHAGVPVGQITEAGANRLGITNAAGSTEFVSINTSSGNVGIGTTTPGSALDVVDSLTASSGIEYGMKILPTVTQTGSAAYTGLLLNVLEATTGSGAKKLLDLQVDGVSKFSVDDTGTVVSTLNQSGATATFTSATGPQFSVGYDSSNKMSVNVGSGGQSTFSTSGASASYNFIGGNVGIGVASPGKALDVSGQIQTSTGVTYNNGKAWDISNSGSDFNINETGVAPRLTFLSGGNVGVGTTTPATKLDVAGDASVLGEIRLLENPGNGNNYVGLRAAASLSGNVIWTLPTTDGSPGLALITNGAGVLSWSQVTNTQLATDSVISANIVDATIINADLANGAVDSSKILDGTIVAIDMATGAVDSTKILDGTIIATDIAAGAVDSSKILDATISTADFATGSVTSSVLADGTIATVDLANSSVTNSKIGAQEITDVKLSGISSSCGSGEILKTNGLGSFYCGAAFTGSGSTSYLPKWTGANSLGDSIVSDNGSAININGNLSFSGANPSLTSGGSYVTIPNGLYVPGGTVYIGNQLQARGGIHNDSGATLMLDGGTGSVTQVNGQFNVTGQIYASSWLRSQTSGTGWYHEVHGGGWFMEDNTWIKAYGGKSVYAPYFYSSALGGYAIHGSGTSGNVGRWTGSNTQGDGSMQDNGSAVGVGTGPTSYRLTVAGDVYANGGWLRTSGSYGWYSESYGGGWFMSDSTWIRAYGDKNIYTGGNMLAGLMQASSFIYSSDKRLKKNIITYPRALKTVDRLHGVSFEWKKDGKEDIGFIAQEVEKVEPRLVVTDEAGMKSVKYGNIVGIVVEAIKELKKENELLKKTLKDQDSRLKRQEELLSRVVNKK